LNTFNKRNSASHPSSTKQGSPLQSLGSFHRKTFHFLTVEEWREIIFVQHMQKHNIKEYVLLLYLILYHDLS
jgi:hypothetical protein